MVGRNLGAALSSQQSAFRQTGRRSAASFAFWPLGCAEDRRPPRNHPTGWAAPDESTVAYRFHASCDFRERASVGCDGFRNGLAVDELPFAAADDEFGLAENLEMVRDSCWAGDCRRRLFGETSPDVRAELPEARREGAKRRGTVRQAQGRLSLRSVTGCGLCVLPRWLTLRAEMAHAP